MNRNNPNDNGETETTSIEDAEEFSTAFSRNGNYIKVRIDVAKVSDSRGVPSIDLRGRIWVNQSLVEDATMFHSGLEMLNFALPNDHPAVDGLTRACPYGEMVGAESLGIESEYETNVIEIPRGFHMQVMDTWIDFHHECMQHPSYRIGDQCSSSEEGGEGEKYNFGDLL